MNYNPLDDEEERKRREAAAAMSDEAVASGGGAVAPTSFMDTAGQFIGNRVDQAMNRVSQAGDALMNPQAALQQRMANEQQQEAADTEVKTQTVKTYGDGSQEQVVKTQVPPEQAQKQQAPMNAMGPVAPNYGLATGQPQEGIRQPQPQAFATQPAQGQRQAFAASPENYSLAAGALQQPSQQGQAGIRQPQPATPTMLPQTGPISPQAGQVAGAPGASLAQAGAQAQAQAQVQDQENGISQQPAPWVQAANDAGTNLTKLFDVAAKHPESRDMIIGKMELALKNKTKEDEAMDIIKDAQNGGLKGLNKLQQAIRPEKGKAKEEVTVNDYLKAYMYKRLGLDAMAADVQNKIIGKDTKFGQVSIAGQNWQVETDPSGQIVRAKDDEGTIATEATLNKLRANAVKSGGQAYGFTGESNTIPVGQPDAGQEYRQRTNSVSGAIENVITTGPNAGTIYGGPPGAAKSVSTAYAKAVNQAFIDSETKPTLAASTEALKNAGMLGEDTYNRTLESIKRRAPDIFRQISSGQAGTPPAPTGTGATTGDNAKMLESLNRDLEANAREVARMPANDPRRKILVDERTKTEARIAELGGRVAPSVGGGAPAQGGGDSLTTIKGKQESAVAIDKAKQQSDINVAEAAKTERVKENAKTIDAKLDQLTSTQRVADTGIQNLQSGNHLFGGGTNQIEYFRQANIPLQERTTNFGNTQAILKLAATDNLETLSKYIKPLSNSDLAYIEKFNINERSSPAEVEKWLGHYYRAASAAYQRQADLYNNPQAPAGKAPPPLSPSGGLASQIPGQNPAAASLPVRKFNLATGRIE